MSPTKESARMLRQAVACFGAGRLDEARQFCQEVLRLDDGSADAHHLWGALELRRGRLDEAKQHIKTALRLRPTRAEYHNSLGAVYAGSKQYAQAIHHYWRATSLEPFYVQAQQNLAQTLGDLGETEEQAQVLEAVLTRDTGVPKDPAALLRAGRRLQQSGRSSDAVACYRRVLTAEPDNVRALRFLGLGLWQIGEIAPAIDAFERVLRFEPDDPESVRNLGLLYLMAGQIEKATRALRKTLDVLPNHGQSYLALAKSGRVTDDDVRHLLSAVQADGEPAEDLPLLHFALGEAFHARKDYEQAFAHFHEGNALRRQQGSYDRQDTSAKIDDLITFFHRGRFSTMGSRFAVGSDRPIFIVGMPRSGTTLVEQILAAHPHVFAAGELDFLKKLTGRMTLVAQPSIEFPMCLERIPDVTLQELAEEHINKLSRLAPNALRVTDKMPWNFHMLGLIALMWPHAKIIHCLRDPMDTCFSCYRTYFAENAHAYSCDLAELGHYYCQYQRLAEHWRAVLPVDVCEVKYESLVEEPKPITRSLVEFCGLKWDEQCLAFHASDRPSKTNPLEVRRPIYSSAIGSWKPYRSHLQPLEEAIGRGA